MVNASGNLPRYKLARDQQVAEFATTVRGLVALRDWLEAHGVTQFNQYSMTSAQEQHLQAYGESVIPLFAG